MRSNVLAIKENNMNAKIKTAVVAIGGNSLIKDSKHQTIECQYEAARETVTHIADMIEAGWNIAIGHGNGPQVGFMLARTEIAHKVAGLHDVPLDTLGADTQGAIGYWLQQNLQNILFHRGIKKNVATVITQVLVDRDDPAFKTPTKPIGGFMDEAEAMKRRNELGWDVVDDAGFRTAETLGGAIVAPVNVMVGSSAIIAMRRPAQPSCKSIALGSKMPSRTYLPDLY